MVFSLYKMPGKHKKSGQGTRSLACIGRWYKSKKSSRKIDKLQESVEMMQEPSIEMIQQPTVEMIKVPSIEMIQESSIEEPTVELIQEPVRHIPYNVLSNHI